MGLYVVKNVIKNKMEDKHKIGDIITLSNNKRDLAFNKVGGLYVKIISLKEDYEGFMVAEVKILATGNIIKILL